MGSQGRVRRANLWLPYPGIGLPVLMVFASTLAKPQSAQGDIVTLQVTGSVTSVNSMDPPGLFDLDGSVTVGSPYSLTFTIDTNAPDINPDTDYGRYLYVTSNGSLGNYAWNSGPAPVYEVETENDLGGIEDRYLLGQPDPVVTGNFVLDGNLTTLDNASFSFVYAGIRLSDATATALDSDALVIPELTDWDTGVFTMHFILDEGQTGIDASILIEGSVDSILIPEPGAVATVASFTVGYILNRRRIHV